MTWKACECCDEWQMIAYGIKHDANCENSQCLRCRLEAMQRNVAAALRFLDYAEHHFDYTVVDPGLRFNVEQARKALTDNPREAEPS